MPIASLLVILGGKNSVQYPLLLKLSFFDLKNDVSIRHSKHPAACNIHCVPFKISIICSYHFSYQVFL